MSASRTKASSASPGDGRLAKGAVRAYCRCNSGHYFQGEFCPIDGWSSRESRELKAAAARLDCDGQEVSLAALRKAGVRPETLRRTVIMVFGSAASAFEALAPDYLVVDGKAQRLTALGPNFK
jgi:hypothetical protein